MTNELTATTVRLTAADVPPPGDGLLAATCSEPPLARLLAGTVAVSCVLETKTVFSAVPFNSTSDALMKLAPVTVIAESGAPTAITEGEIDVTEGAGLEGTELVVAVCDPPLQETMVNETAVKRITTRQLQDRMNAPLSAPVSLKGHMVNKPRTIWFLCKRYGSIPCRNFMS